VIMDVQMPGISGLEATRRLKSDPLTARMPVIIVTGHDMNRKEAREARHDAFLKKPVVEQELRAMIERLLSMQSPG
jgi:two-component system, cell cycle response regulator DivK